MLSKVLDCLMFGTKVIFYILGVYVIKSSVNNEKSVVVFLSRIILNSNIIQISHGISCVRWGWS